MHTVAAVFLLPVGVVLYTIFGGIKATFITDYVCSPGMNYLHTSIN